MANEEPALSEIKTFITDYIDSVVQLEVLLLLYNHPQQDWDAAGVAQALRIAASWVEIQMANLAARGLLTGQDHPEPRYRYGPQTPELHEAVVRLAQAYTERRVTVINMIYSRPPDTLRAFTEAFRFRKDRRDG